VNNGSQYGIRQISAAVSHAQQAWHKLGAMFVSILRRCFGCRFEMGLDLMRHLLSGVAVVALAAASPALAADLPLKAPPPAVAAWGWSGFYVGGHGGYGWGHDSQTDPNDPFFFGKVPGFGGFTGFDPKGALGGVHAGFNWQSGAIVGGLEGDLSFTDIKGSSLNSASAATTFSVNSLTATNSGAFDMLGSGRGRLGYLVSPNVLLYGTGGLAWTRFVNNQDSTSLSVNIPPPGAFGINTSVSSPSWRFGWVAGLGVETRLFDSNWLARLEYLHYDFGNSGSSARSDFLSSQTTGNLTLDVVRAGISYKFGQDSFAGGASNPALVYKAAAPASQPWTWSGYYLGAHAGYGWARDPFTNFLVNFVPLNGVDSRGFVGGFQAGANWQSGSFVGGLEIDLSGTGIKGSTSNSTSANGIIDQGTQTDKLDWFGSARARLGYLVTSDVLLYATGGPGWARMVTDQEGVATTVGFPPPTTTSSVFPTWIFGWVAGAGVETRLWNTNWLARLEYLHYDFGSGSSSQNIPAGGGLVTTRTSGHLTNDVVQAGLSYKFDWPGMGGGPRSAYNAMAAMPPAAAIWSWSGFYVGVNGGYGWGRDPISDVVATTPSGANLILSGVNSQGFIGGFQAGANLQMGSVVGGLEIDLSGSGIKGTSSIAGLDGSGFPISQMQTDKFDLLGSGRARVGYLVSPNTLLYGTGGLAWTRITQTTTIVNSDGTTIDTTPSWRFGWAAGAGGEMRLWNTNWLARVEYLHYDFGDSGNVIAAFTNGTTSFNFANMTSHHLTADTVRAGFGYKFN
jgi:opacity protein-like surface antigen